MARKKIKGASAHIEGLVTLIRTAGTEAGFICPDCGAKSKPDPDQDHKENYTKHKGWCAYAQACQSENISQ